VTGRCISTTHEAQGSTLALEASCSPRAIEVAKLQTRLEAEGALL
jgi:hypothetical protein